METGRSHEGRPHDLRDPRAEASPSRVRLELLGGFSLLIGGTLVAVPPASERLLAFVATYCRGAVPRALVAARLWPDAPERCAYANLRSTLSRMCSIGRTALDVTSYTVCLAQDASVDLRRSRALAALVLAPGSSTRDRGFGVETVTELSADLLPGWYEDWAVQEAEAWRYLRTHALGTLAEDFIASRRYAEAVIAAHAAVRADPLRESSCATLIRAHLAEGNAAQALREFDRYVRRLRAEMGLEPPPRLCRLIAGVRPSDVRSDPRNVPGRADRSRPGDERSPSVTGNTGHGCGAPPRVV